jgi:hypothetical protein
MANRRTNEAVSELVRRLNQDGMAALEPHGNAGPKPDLRRCGMRPNYARWEAHARSTSGRNRNVVPDALA